MKYSIATMSALGVLISTTSMAGSAGDAAQAKFNELDRNSNQMIEQQELQTMAQSRNVNADQLLRTFDRNSDQALSEQEFKRLSEALQRKTQQSQAASAEMASAQGSDPQSGQQTEQQLQGSKIVVQEKPTQIEVTKPAAQVTIDQPQPKVTVTTQDPKVNVEQGDPKVSVSQPEPEVAVEQADPEVEVREAEPEISVDRSEPQVTMDSEQPQVDVEERKSELASQGDRVNTQPADNDAGSQSTASDDSQNAFYTTPVKQLKDAKVADDQGNELGKVVEVVIKQDGTEAGIIMSTQGSPEAEPNFVFAPADKIELRDGDLIVDASTVKNAPKQLENFSPEQYRSTPATERTLKQMLDERGITAR